jgi:replicative DNA helicase
MAVSVDAGAPPGFRTPPHSVEAEQAVLGAILYENEIFAAVCGFLRSAHFYHPVHARMFKAIERLITSGKQADHITLLRAFRDDPELRELDGKKYLVGLAEAGAIRQFDALAYAKHLLDLALKRALICVGEGVVDQAYDPATPRADRRCWPRSRKPRPS